MKDEEMMSTIYREIKNKIISGELQEEEKISERNICENFNAPRSIVRNVISNLRRDGWLYVRPKSGTYVTPLNLKIAQDVFDTRLIIEPAVATISLPHLTKEDIQKLEENCQIMEEAAHSLSPVFYEKELDNHRILRHRCGNKILVKILEDIEDQYERLSHKTPLSEKRRLASVDEWRHIIECARKKDTFMVGNYIAHHILNFADEFWKLI